MANWITHEIIVDYMLSKELNLDERGFSVGNIAPDCNLENADWTEYIPSREVTHWMSSDKKQDKDYDRFFHEIIEGQTFQSKEHLSFLLGYYAHLITDVEFHKLMNDEEHIKLIYKRMKSDYNMKAKIEGYPETKDTLKKVFGRRGHVKDIIAFEHNYVINNPNCAYNRILRNIHKFTEYLEIFPKGSITRKINIMAHAVSEPIIQENYFFFTKEEYEEFIHRITNKVYELLLETGHVHQEVHD